MYEVKFQNKDDKSVLYVLEFASSVNEAMVIAARYLASEIKEVYSISLSQYKEAFHSDSAVADQKWYGVTLQQETIDENGKEKTIKYKILVEAKDFDECYERVKVIAKEGYEMTKRGISETSIQYVLTDKMTKDYEVTATVVSSDQPNTNY